MVDNIQYKTQEWLSKRKEILQRDNFSCQNCNTFNPSEGTVTVFNEKEGDIELHNYNSNACQYILTSHKHGITLNLDYGWGLWLVTPILQVHHKRYIQDKNPWEYEDNDLITLCKECHNSYHEKNTIPIYDPELNLIQEKLFSPEDNNTGRKHNFKPWVFINNYSGEYEASPVQPSMDFFVPAEDSNRITELKDIADEMYAYFMERFLPDYKSKKN